MEAVPPISLGSGWRGSGEAEAGGRYWGIGV